MLRLGCATLAVMTAILSWACTARQNAPVPRPFPGAAAPPTAPATPDPAAPVPPPTTPSDAAAPTAEALRTTPIIDTALAFRGVPYRYGGSDPTGFDCSGFVQYVYAKHGIALPREVRDQYDVGDDVRLTEVRPGDLIFFETVGRGASHVGMAIGGDQFVHAPSSTGVVRVERFSSSYWASRLVGARRLTR